MRSFLILLASLFIHSFSYGQWGGYETGIFSGVHALYIQPADIANTHYKFDGNLLSLKLTLFGNQVVPETSVAGALTSSGIFDLDRYFSLKSQEVVLFANTLLPSGIFAINQKMAVGFSVRLNAFLINNSSNTILKQIYFNEIEELDGQEFDNEFVSTYMHGWVSYNASFASVLINKDKHLFKFGTTVKFLQGIASAKIEFKDLSFNVENDELQNLEANIALVYSESIDDLVDGNSPRLKGRYGGGVDIGFSYEYRPKQYRINNYLGYKFKAGISLLQIGAITYQKGESSLDFRAGVEHLSLSTFESVQTFDEFSDSLKSAFNVENDSSEIYVFKLPMVFSLQFDYNLGKNFYLHINPSITFFQLMIKGDDNLTNSYRVAITPRFETKRYGVYLPLIYDNHFKFSAGISLRWKAFVIGSSNIFSRWFYPKDEQIGTFYGMIKIPILQKEFRDLGKKKRKAQSPDSRYLQERLK